MAGAPTDPFVTSSPAESTAGWRGPGRTLEDVTVLVVGRRSPRLATLGSWLATEGCEVIRAGRLADALTPASMYRPDVVVLDVGDAAPWVLGALRTWTDLPAIVVDAGRGAPLEAAFEAGADDYLAVPVRRTELLARLRSIMRRQRPPRDDKAVRPGALVTTPHFELDLDTHRASAGGRAVHVTPTEWRIIEVLVRRPGVLVAQSDIVSMVWGHGSTDQTHALRVHLSSIRRKLEPDPARPSYFTTEFGVGLRFVADGPTTSGPPTEP